jgi:hypothetical protein
MVDIWYVQCTDRASASRVGAFICSGAHTRMVCSSILAEITNSGHHVVLCICVHTYMNTDAYAHPRQAV